MKQFSDSCVRNQAPILESLQSIVPGNASILEIGSGTGQHAVYFAAHQPDWQIQPSDRPGTLESVEAWREESALENIRPAIALDVNGEWPAERFQVIYSANTLHIMSAADVEAFFRSAPECLFPGGQLCIYDPFKHEGEFTSASNADFDAMLRARDPLSGIRDFEWLIELAAAQSLTWQATIPMPANNELVVFQQQDRPA